MSRRPFGVAGMALGGARRRGGAIWDLKGWHPFDQRSAAEIIADTKRDDEKEELEHMRRQAEMAKLRGEGGMTLGGMGEGGMTLGGMGEGGMALGGAVSRTRGGFLQMLLPMLPQILSGLLPLAMPLLQQLLGGFGTATANNKGGKYTGPRGHPLTAAAAAAKLRSVIENYAALDEKRELLRQRRPLTAYKPNRKTGVAKMRTRIPRKYLPVDARMLERLVASEQAFPEEFTSARKARANIWGVRPQNPAWAEYHTAAAARRRRPRAAVPAAAAPAVAAAEDAADEAHADGAPPAEQHAAAVEAAVDAGARPAVAEAIADNVAPAGHDEREPPPSRKSLHLGVEKYRQWLGRHGYT